MFELLNQAMWLALSAATVIAGALAVPALAATVVYVSHSESNDIYVYQLNRQTGELTLLELVPIPGVVKAGMSTPMAVSPDRRCLYVATRGEPPDGFPTLARSTWVARTVTWPPSRVNLTALASRLYRICLTLRRSA